MKWAGIFLGGLVGLLLLACLVLYFVGLGKLSKTYPNIPVETVSVPTGADGVSRGGHVAIVWACEKCHGDNLGGSPANSLNSETTLMGTVPAPNLTSGDGGIGTTYTDADWVRAIRHGVKPDGHAEISMYNYWPLSDQDLGDLIAYLKQLPLVDASYPAPSVGALYAIVAGAGLEIPAAAEINHSAPRPTASAPAASAEYGAYLYTMCLGCHSANFYRRIAPMKQDDFARTMRTGVMPNGDHLSEAMTTKNFAAMTDTELAALWLYAQNAQSNAKQ